MGDEVEYPTEYMTSLANTRQTRWDTDSSEGIKKIRDGLADESSFGEIPVLASYGRVFSEVRKIYLETLRGARLDLDAVAQGIKTSAKQMRDNDDAAGAAFLELWQRWEQGPLESTRNQSEAASTRAAQEAAADADSAEGATGALPEGEVPTEDDAVVANPDTRDEGAIPTGRPDAPLPQ